MAQSVFERMGGTYHREGDYLIPDLIAPPAPKIGVWGVRRKRYLQQYHDGIYTGMLLSAGIDVGDVYLYEGYDSGIRFSVILRRRHKLHPLFRIFYGPQAAKSLRLPFSEDYTISMPRCKCAAAPACARSFPGAGIPECPAAAGLRRKGLKKPIPSSAPGTRTRMRRRRYRR